MTSFLLKTAVFCAVALPAAAQIAPPAGPDAPPAANAAIAHHDRMVAHRASRHGNPRKAAAAARAANAAAVDSMAPH